MSDVITPVNTVIPEKRIVVFSPHYDDFLFMLGGYVLELKEEGLLSSKSFHINLLFSRSNYLARTGPDNLDTSLDRLKLTTGKRLLEDQECINELLGRYNYTYELGGEDECFVRGKQFAESDMEFPHGMFADFNETDWQIFERMKQRIRRFAMQDDTALVFPLAFKEHVDHFITREAAIAVALEFKEDLRAAFYFQEDKPYGGLATPEELRRTSAFISHHRLDAKTYFAKYEHVVELAFKHYISQVEEVYHTGIANRALFLQQECQAVRPCDRIYRFEF